MERSRLRTAFVCQQCGKESQKWLGRCPECQEWNTFVQVTSRPQQVGTSRTLTPEESPQELSRIDISENTRLSPPLPEFNRVLGGGIVPGSLALVGGDPGIGKSTLLLQVSDLVAQAAGEVLYASGEESVEQVKLRAKRLGIKGERLYLIAETNLDIVLQLVEKRPPRMLVVDSIQTSYVEGLEATPGSVTQVRECALRLMRWAKHTGIPVMITGHVTKEGTLAGPRLLEHMVDVVMYLEGDPLTPYRLLRNVKNRFGSTHEVGVFEMTGRGLVGVDNPSLLFLSQRGENTIGSSVVPTLEGTRPILVEIQALVSPTPFSLARRTANGVEFNRLLLIIAVLGKRLNLSLANQDVIVNVAGGLSISEPAADLGIALSVASSFRDAEVRPDMAAVGEIGLNGELRAVPDLERRLAEAKRLGFKFCLAPKLRAAKLSGEVQVVEVGSLGEALRAGLLPARRKKTPQ